MVIRRGDVFWVKFRDGRRPGAIITRDSAIDLLHRIAVVPATTTIRSSPTEVRLGTQDGMPTDCALTIDNVRVVPKAWLGGRITTLSPARLEEICDKLAYAFGC